MTDTTGAAIALLQRGVLLDSERRYTEAIIHYMEGLQLLLDSMKCMSDPVKKQQINKKVKEYLTRAENLKQYVKNQKDLGKYHEQIKIKNDDIGYSYQKVFGRFLNEEVVSINVEDAFIRTYHQCQNFLRFCELAVKSCKSNLKNISLKTIKETSPKEKEQENLLGKICGSLQKHNVTLTITYSSTLHDRQIILSNGWNIKIGRGLDYFKAPDNNMCLGSCDMDLRRCHETVVDIFHISAVRSA